MSSDVYRVAVVCDTHVGDTLAAIPDGLISAVQGVDLILHAGDVTDSLVLDALGVCAPVIAVQGNHDRDAGLVLPTQRVVTIGGIRIGMAHGDRHWIAEYASILRGLLRGRPSMHGAARTLVRRLGHVDVIIFGHFHCPYLAWWGQTLVFSPGAVYVVDADPEIEVRGMRRRLVHRFRRGVPESGRIPSIGILEIRDGVVTPSVVPIPGALRPASVPTGRN
jgi:putative phosphoesterase